MIAAAHVWKRFAKNSFDKISNFPHKSDDFPPLSLLCFSTSVVKKSLRSDMLLDILSNKHHFSPQAASRVASALSHVRNPRKVDAAISFFKEAGFSSSQLEKVARYRPQLLSASLERNIKPKIKIFRDLGCSSDDLAEMISNSPWLLIRGVKMMAPAVSILKGLLGSDAEVAKLLKVSCWFVSADLRRTLKPNLDLLASCGFSSDQLVHLMFRFPRLLLNGEKKLKKSIEKAEEMGVKRSSKIFVYAVRVLSSMSEETWSLKVKAFRDIGFSEQDILRVFRTAPVVFNISEQKIKKVAHLLLSTGKYDTSVIVSYPVALCRSIEKWYNPRFRVLEALEGKGLLKKWPSFSKFYNMREEEFVERYVSPYEDLVGDMYRFLRS